MLLLITTAQKTQTLIFHESVTYFLQWISKGLKRRMSQFSCVCVVCPGVQFASPMYFFDTGHLTEPRILIYYYCPVNSRDSSPPNWIYRCALPCLAFTWVPTSFCFCGRHSAGRPSYLPSPEKLTLKSY